MNLCTGCIIFGAELVILTVPVPASNDMPLPRSVVKLVTPVLVNVTEPLGALTEIPGPANAEVTPVLEIVTEPVADDTDTPVLPANEVTPVLVNVMVSVNGIVVIEMPDAEKFKTPVSELAKTSPCPATEICPKLTLVGSFINEPPTVLPVGRFTAPDMSAVISASPR